MTNELNSKRFNDDELEAVSGGVTPPSVDPAALAAQIMQSQLNAALAVAGGGNYAVDTPTPAPGASLQLPAAADIPHGTITFSNPNIIIANPNGPPAEPPPPAQDSVHYANNEGSFTRIIPTVSGQAPPSGPGGGTYNIANRQGIAFNLPSDK